ncbi:MAG TPA: winged helix-turn-helix domain-containing protein [Acidobacteriota bacterium]|nr:winged helix-turn-helix domain-containing protein [Acidobacteriota bacterium]
MQPTLNRITVGEREQRIEPKAMQVLVYLAERPGKVVGKEELLHKVWDGSAVVEKVLTRIISLLRQVFKDDPRHPSVIETIPRKGYRLIAPVEPAATAWRAAESPRNSGGGGFSRFRFAALATLFVTVLVLAAASSLIPPAPDGFDYRTITEIAIPWGLACTPVLSPDGRDLAYVHWAEDGTTHIKIQRIGLSQPIQRTRSSHSDFAPAWSPDGQWLAFLRESSETGSCRLMMMPSLTGEEQVLAPCPPFYSTVQLNWSPDGKRLALAGSYSEEEPHRVLELSLESRETVPVTDPPHSSIGDYSPEYSPDGRYLAFMRSIAPNRQQLMIRDLESGRERELGQEETIVINLAWTSDSKQIVYAAYRAGTFQLFKIGPHGGKAAWLPAQGMKVSMPDIALRSNRLVYMTFDFNADIWKMTLAPSGLELEAAQPLFKSTGLDYSPVLSPDGREVAFISRATGRPQVWIGSQDGAQRRPVGDCEGALIASVAWSPDGRRIAYPCPAAEAEPASLILLSLDDGQRRLIFLDEAAQEVVWPRDGDALVYSSGERNRSQIYRLALSSPLPEALTEKGAWQPRLAPDGETVYYRGYDSDEVFLLGAPDRPVACLPRSNAGVWGVGEGAIYARGPGKSLQRIDLKSGETVAIEPVEPWPQLGRSAFSISPDGRILAVEQVLSDSQFMYFDLPRQ